LFNERAELRAVSWGRPRPPWACQQCPNRVASRGLDASPTCPACQCSRRCLRRFRAPAPRRPRVAMRNAGMILRPLCARASTPRCTCESVRNGPQAQLAPKSPSRKTRPAARGPTAREALRHTPLARASMHARADSVRILTLFSLRPSTCRKAAAWRCAPRRSLGPWRLPPCA
jgi:hypothetical protein